ADNRFFPLNFYFGGTRRHFRVAFRDFDILLERHGCSPPASGCANRGWGKRRFDCLASHSTSSTPIAIWPASDLSRPELVAIIINTNTTMTRMQPITAATLS